VEVDSTYYAIPAPRMVSRWAERTPETFRFTLKLFRDLLDPKRPLDREALARFHQSAALLGNKLSAILLQFPPWVKPGRARSHIEHLLEGLDPRFRYAVELRDAGWFSGSDRDWILEELRARRIALCWSYLTYVDVPPIETTDFLYVRFIGDHTTVPSDVHGEVRIDRSETLTLWAERVLKASAAVQQTFVFFNNHFAGFAPASINAFRERVGLPNIDFGPGTSAARSEGRAPKTRMSRLEVS
jgi:uncharacterized protein YecE (DUF72 family)